MTRKTASELAGSGMGSRSKRGVCWYDYLPEAEQKYVDSVVDEIVESPDIPIIAVAAGLIQELSIPRVSHTVESFLRERVRHAEAAKKS